jgi:hypothetical protein
MISVALVSVTRTIIIVVLLTPRHGLGTYQMRVFKEQGREAYGRVEVKF